MYYYCTAMLFSEIFISYMQRTAKPNFATLTFNFNTPHWVIHVNTHPFNCSLSSSVTYTFVHGWLSLNSIYGH